MYSHTIAKRARMTFMSRFSSITLEICISIMGIKRLIGLTKRRKVDIVGPWCGFLDVVWAVLALWDPLQCVTT